jgi:hypothetical protein
MIFNTIKILNARNIKRTQRFGDENKYKGFSRIISSPTKPGSAGRSSVRIDMTRL